MNLFSTRRIEHFPEQDSWTFGQMLPVILVLSPCLNLLRSIYLGMSTTRSLYRVLHKPSGILSRQHVQFNILADAIFVVLSTATVVESEDSSRMLRYDIQPPGLVAQQQIPSQINDTGLEEELESYHIESPKQYHYQETRWFLALVSLVLFAVVVVTATFLQDLASGNAIIRSIRYYAVWVCIVPWFAFLYYTVMALNLYRRLPKWSLLHFAIHQSVLLQSLR